MSEPNKAVFLSYASQDAEAAKRICDALRAAGVEVWFDQSELRGGDSWDAKIRKQIKECALFVPIISASTNSRPEGYFRLEWKLAVDRSHLLADDHPFLFPVVIDDTADATARVPEKFRDVQWTRLSVKDTPETLAVRVGRLMRQEHESGSVEPRTEDRRPRGKARPAWLRYAWAGVGILFGLIYAVRPLWQPARHSENPPAPPATVAPHSEAQKLTQQARALIDDDLMAGRENFRLAQELAQKATVMDPTDGEAWATLARVLVETWARNYDATLQLREQARSAVDRATRLAPASAESGLAASGYQALSGQNGEAERIARETLARYPNDQRCLRLLAEICMATDKGPEALELLHRSGSLNGGDVRALADEAGYYRGQMRLIEAEAIVDRAMALAPSFGGFQLKLLLLMQLDDLDRAQPIVEQIPARLQQEDVFASLIASYWLHRGEPDRALEVLQRVPRDFFEEQRQYLPKGWPTGWALQMAGRPAAAKLEWEQALAVVEKRLKTEPNRRDLILYRSRLLALLGRRAEADVAVQLALELNSKDKVGASISLANVSVCAGDNEGAIKHLLVAMRDPAELFGHGLWQNLKHHPMYAPIRSDPRIQQLIAWGDERMRQLKAGGAAPSSSGLTPHTLNLTPPRPSVDAKSVAVLAFANLSDDKSNEYFSDGISEELLNVLSKVQGLKVSARTSAFYFKGKQVPIAEIAQQLGVAYVVEGSVRKQGDKVRITAQLIKASDGFHVWSDTFTRDLKDIFAVQDEIAGLVADQLSLKLGTSSAVSRAAVDPQAFELYVQARQAWNLRNEEGLARAETLLNRALEIAPGFARAHAALADVWYFQTVTKGITGTFARPDPPEFGRVLQKAREALALDPGSAEAHASLGNVLFSSWKYAEAEREYRQAVALNPNYASAHQWLGAVLSNDGRIEEALAECRRASELDPLSSRIADNLGYVLHLAGRYTEAVAMYERAIALQPSNAQALWYRPLMLAHAGRMDEAVASAKALPVSLPTTPAVQLNVYILAGLHREAEALVPAALAGGAVPRCLVLLLLGRKEEAVAALDPGATDLPGNYLLPDYDQLDSDPRFRNFIATIGWTEARARIMAWRAAHPPEKPEAKK